MPIRVTVCRGLIAVAGWSVLALIGCDSQFIGRPSGTATDLLDPSAGAAETAVESQMLTADAGPDLTVASGATVVLRGKASHPGVDVARLQFHWTEVSALAAKDAPRQRVVLGQKLVFEAPAGPVMLDFCFHVNDHYGDTAEDCCQVRVLPPGSNPAEPPPTAVIVSGTTGWLDNASTPYLHDPGADFPAAGVSGSSDVLEVISGQGVIPGIYGIVAVYTSELYLDADAGQSETGDVSYRVLRP